MILLISPAITVAFASSLVSLTGLLDLEFWWELASLIVIMLLGHWQEMKGIGQAIGTLASGVMPPGSVSGHTGRS